MKKLFLILMLGVLGVFISSCDTEDDPLSPNEGRIIITSNPTEAQIWQGNSNTGKLTNDTLTLSAGNHEITLKLNDYADTTFTVVVEEGETNTHTAVNLLKNGKVFVESTPIGTQIWVHGMNSGKVAPDTLSLKPGSHDVTLRLTDYKDTTFTVTVVSNQLINRSITMNPELVLYTSVRIYETVGTNASQPSGLDLSTGMAYGLTGANKMDVDIYYSSNGFLVQSAHLNTTNGLTRVTKFRVGNGTDLNDGTDSPLQNSGTWTDNIADTQSNYVFLYDHDGRYTKAEITDMGGGTPGNPAWVELTWWYNKAEGNVSF